MMHWVMTAPSRREGAATSAAPFDAVVLCERAIVIGIDQELRQRWDRALDLASAKADDQNVPEPTRYDALRMLAAEPWAKRGAQLTRYLAKVTPAELQAGAVAAVGDVEGPEAAAALLEALPGLTPDNRNAAVDALLRDESRAAALENALQAGKVDRKLIDAAHRRRLPNGSR